MQSSSTMAGTLKATTDAMGQMNKVMDPAKMNKTLQEFSKESMKMGMTDEMSKDTSILIYSELSLNDIHFQLATPWMTFSMNPETRRNKITLSTRFWTKLGSRLLGR